MCNPLNTTNLLYYYAKTLYYFFAPTQKVIYYYLKAQHQDFGGKCGICGDPYEGYQPHQVPGKWATGIIGRSYFQPGQVNFCFIYTSKYSI